MAKSRALGTPVERWAGLGPYYAMFPLDFAFEVVKTYCPPSGRVLDPFAGRASSVYAAAATGRFGLGIEINPVGWLYGRVKLAPAAIDHVLERLVQIGQLAAQVDPEQLAELPEFFPSCFAPNVLRFLLAARQHLEWRSSRTDATLMAIVLVYLHGKRNASLSNQMRQGKAMSPPYAIRWWQDRGMRPPERDPLAFLTPRIMWRYAKGELQVAASKVVLGDSLRVLSDVKGQVTRGRQQQFDLLFTSPPYWGISNYHYDQWLRLWLLGGSVRPTRTGGEWLSKFQGRAQYTRLIHTAFMRSSALLAEQATVYVRTDARPFTLATTGAALAAAFPGRRMNIVRRPLRRHTQTALFGDVSPKPGEVDLIIRGH